MEWWKIWLTRFLVVVPVLCLVIGVVLWKQTRNEAYDIQTAKRELKAEFAAEIEKLQSEVENLHTEKRAIRSEVDNLQTEKREIRSQIESDKSELQEELQSEVANLHTEKREIRRQIESDKSELQQQLQSQVDNLHTEKRKLQSRIKRDTVKLERQLKDITTVTSANNRERRQADSTGGGAVYVHWGRIDCPCSAELVYSGVAGGGHYTHTGAAVNMLCMTHEPVWAKYGNDGNHYTFLYGTEYEVFSNNDFPLGHDRAEKLHNHDVPCSVCRSANRSSAIMIPGTTVCEAGWTREYSGYLMAGYYTHASGTEYNCIDANPDADGAANKNGYLLYRVKAKCGSLPCPPYVEMREIACVVCTK